MTDAIVVGAGPAGCAAAIVLARAGARVRLIDRCRFPRRKLCGDTINPGACAILRRLGVEREALRGGLPVRGMTVTGGGVAISGVYPDAHRGVAIAREVFDERLVRAAAAAGVAVEEGVTVTGPLVQGVGREARIAGVLVRRRRGASSPLRARICIAADGRHSRLAFALGLARHPEWPRRWAVGAYFQQVDHAAADLGEMHIRDGHYIGVARLPGGLTNVCLVTADRARLSDPKRALGDVVAGDPLLAGRFVLARRVSPVAMLGPLAVETSSAGMSGLLLAGDAAGFVDPMTGDGLRFALRSGELAAAAALEALQNGGAAAAHVALTRLRREFRPKRAFNRVLRRIVDSPRAIDLAATGARLAPALLRALIRIAGDVPAASAA